MEWEIVDIRQAVGSREVRGFDTADLRKTFLVEEIFSPGEVRLVYTHYDRMILGGAELRSGKELKLEAPEELKAKYFLERREIGIFCIAGSGYIGVDGERYDLEFEQCLYVGRGSREVVLGADDDSARTKFYFVSTPAHREYPSQVSEEHLIRSLKLGETRLSNQRTLNQYIHADGIQSCQLMMGLTRLDEGNVWNTMPPHTHDRRSEVYLYLDLSEKSRVMHFMGQPAETRHVVVGNEEAMISPGWSVHAGAGTENYAFIWAMAGENYTFDDMDQVPLEELR